MGQAPPLWPREYGAYAELGFPLLTAFLLAGPTIAGVAFAAAVSCGFLLYEPLLVARGARGRRLQEAAAPRARRRIVLLVAGGAAAGLAAFATAPPAARLAALVPGVCAVLVLFPVLRGRPKTLGTELVVATALAAMLPPVALAGGATPTHAAQLTAVWLASFWLTTLAVHAIKARAKPERRAPWTVAVTPVLALLVIVGGLLGAASQGVRPPLALALLPPALVVLAAVALKIHPRHLRRVGWTLAGANGVTLVLLLLA
ncbi:MAG: YwiC-like family protein [Gemmatimonadota bacterium]|nr:YwiC-like family protein [Gemmatimonadota bacterium]